jgi:hypothetical protein
VRARVEVLLQRGNGVGGVVLEYAIASLSGERWNLARPTTDATVNRAVPSASASFVVWGCFADTSGYQRRSKRSAESLALHARL